MKETEFIKKYVKDFNNLIKSDDDLIEILIEIKRSILEAKKQNKKVIIIGNGGSAAISSHFSVDLTKNANVRCINFNESDLITCFANDFGYEEAFKKAISFYGDKGDLLIAISSSGKSLNILNACQAAKDLDFSKIVTFSGMNKDNPLSKTGDINLWVDSKAYNLIENIHQFYLLMIIDLIIGKSVYSV
tara:strand:- start:6024 stop:6590 length:567 start_codon:yes stop_codon:yes gene_type:complete